MIKDGPPKPRHKLEWLEAGRGVAAAIVMVSHGHTVVPMPAMYVLGDLGVAFFFVLSGFIIHFIHRGDIGSPARAPNFAWRRLTRILPTYWMVLVLWLALNQLQKPFARFHLDLPTVAGQIILLPSQKMLLGPAWTLQCEFLFYFMFLTLILARRFGLVVMGLWLIVLVWQFTVTGIFLGARPVPHPTDLLLHQLNFYFFAGLLVGLAQERGRIGLYLVLSSGAAAVLLLLDTALPDADVRYRAAGLTCLFGALVGLLVFVSQREIRCPSWLVNLGAISFPLYLLHLPIFVALHGVMNIVGRYVAPPWWLVLPFQLGIAIAGAALFYVLYDRPVVRWLARHGPARRRE